MVEYTCEVCSYTTSYTTSFKKHLKTKKHLANEKIKNINSKNTFEMHPDAPKMHPQKLDNKTCKFCNKSFTRTTGLKKHLNICSYRNTVQDAPKCTQNVNKMSTNVNIMSTKCQQMSTLNKNQCQYCMKLFTTRQGKSKHLQTCKSKIKEESNEKKIELMEKEIYTQKLQMDELKQTNITLTNNVQNNTKIGTQNNGTINYLNIHFNNVQPIDLFLENLKTNFKLSNSDRKCLLDTFNECDVNSFANIFCIIMKKNLVQQIEQDILPTMPLVCTDSNLRSIKEFHEDGWKSTQSNKSIDQMIDISNDQIYESEKTKIFISQKERKKIYDKMKKDNSLPSMENDKKNQQQCVDKKIENQENKTHTEEINIHPNKTDDELYDELYNVNELSKNYDFSIIDNDLLEKHACIKLP